jgi:hypothetical protein
MSVLLPILAILGFTSGQAADVTLASVQPQVQRPENHPCSTRRTSQLTFIAWRSA